MKRVAFLFLLLASLAAIAAVRTTATLSWDYPASELSSVTFNVYFTTNLTPPVTWTFQTNATGTNCLVNILPGNGFWYATASNEFCESIPSNTATSTVARIVNVKIK